MNSNRGFGDWKNQYINLTINQILESKNEESDIDAEIIPLIIVVNNIIGLKTYSSCSGHGFRDSYLGLLIDDNHLKLIIKAANNYEPGVKIEDSNDDSIKYIESKELILTILPNQNDGLMPYNNDFQLIIRGKNRLNNNEINYLAENLERKIQEIELKIKRTKIPDIIKKSKELKSLNDYLTKNNWLNHFVNTFCNPTIRLLNEYKKLLKN